MATIVAARAALHADQTGNGSPGHSQSLDASSTGTPAGSDAGTITAGTGWQGPLDRGVRVCPLPDNPTRAMLRDAARMLKGLAGRYPAVAAELADVQARLSSMEATHKKSARAVAAVMGLPTVAVKFRPAPRKNDRSHILADDCLGTCQACRGKGSYDTRIGIDCWTKTPCERCGGRGVRAVAVGERTEDDGVYGCPVVMRGDYADPFFSSDRQTAIAEGFIEEIEATPRCHTRGFVHQIRGTHSPVDGGDGRVVGPFVGTRDVAGAVADAFHECDWRGMAVDDQGHPPAVDRKHYDAIDLASELEAKARQRLSGWTSGGPRGRQQVKKSRRDRGILTNGQEKRAGMARRVALYQAILNRQTRALNAPMEAAIELTDDEMLAAEQKAAIKWAELMAKRRQYPDLEPPLDARTPGGCRMLEDGEVSDEAEGLGAVEADGVVADESEVLA